MTDFGWQYNKTYQDWRFYPGIDLSVANKEIPAFKDGEVEGVINGMEIGIAVIITTGQYKIYYASLTGTSLKKGDYITAGDTVGVVETGNLHLRVQSAATGDYIDPTAVLLR
jgi:murein DD-endopeptidase MepM/ murein hydrolase activator NlpD